MTRARRPSRPKQKLTPPYFVWRDGRPRWEPGPGVRALGFSGRDLKDASGGWLPLGHAIEAARVINDEVEAARTGGGKRAKSRRPPRCRKETRTVAALHERWIATPEYRRLRDKTREDYRQKIRVFLADFGGEPVRAITRVTLKNWWRHLHDTRGHAMANGVMAVVRAMLTYARDEAWIDTHPAERLGLPGVDPRVVCWTPAECELFISTADEMGEHAIADAVFLALHTGQRQGDVLGLTLEKIDRGRVVLRQGKRGARVSVPLTPQLAGRLEAIRARRRQGELVDLAAARRLVLRQDGKEYDKGSFGKAFRPIRDRVAEALPEIASKQFRDLRDTAITRLALAGCTVAEIASITGHEMETVHQVLRHYLALGDRLADAAMTKLEAYMQEEGIRV